MPVPHLPKLRIRSLTESGSVRRTDPQPLQRWCRRGLPQAPQSQRCVRGPQPNAIFTLPKIRLHFEDYSCTHPRSGLRMRMPHVLFSRKISIQGDCPVGWDPVQEANSMSVAKTLSRARALDQSRRLVLGGFLGLLILFQAFSGLFAIWYSHESAAKNRKELSEITHTLNIIRSARDGFGVQIQEWKNIIIRGFDPALHARHHDNFQKEASDVQSDLGLLHGANDAIIGRISTIRSAHAGLTDLYVESLRTADLTTLAGQRALDAAVRGRDRALQVLFDELATALAEAHRAEVTRAALAEDDLFSTMRLLLFVCGGLGLFATSLVLLMLLRHR